MVWPWLTLLKIPAVSYKTKKFSFPNPCSSALGPLRACSSFLFFPLPSLFSFPLPPLPVILPSSSASCVVSVLLGHPQGRFWLSECSGLQKNQDRVAWEHWVCCLPCASLPALDRNSNQTWHAPGVVTFLSLGELVGAIVPSEVVCGVKCSLRFDY